MRNIFFELTRTTAADWAATPLLAAVLIVLCRVDLRERRLPDWGTLPLLLVGILLAFWRHSGEMPWPEIGGAAAGYGVFGAIGAAFWRLRGREGLGLGDAKLAAAGGAWIGLALLPLMVLIAASSALIFVILGNRARADDIPFGPWLAFGIICCWGIRLATA